MPRSGSSSTCSSVSPTATGIHTVDFAPVECRPQTWVVLRPGQVQQFDPAAGWDGWLTTFRPEFIRSETTQLAGTSAATEAAPRLLSGQVELSDADHKACLETVERMALDAAALVDMPARHALLQSQLRTLRLRLQLAQRQSGGFVHAPDAAFDLFQRFEQLIDADLSHNHNVGEYAKKLGCSERTLTRATTSVRSVSAKAFLSQRIALEAKRLLIHTARTVAQIASDIGFDEATNFVKFFRREVGIPPGEYRLHYAERYG